MKKMAEIKFTVHGEPVAQGRPKFARRGGFVQVYDPPKSKEYKQQCTDVAENFRPSKLLEGPLQVEIIIFKGSLKSFSKKNKELAESGELRPTTKPDADNYAKGPLDAFKGVLWSDDGQVVDLIARKFYSSSPRIEVTVKEIQPQQQNLF